MEESSHLRPGDKVEVFGLESGIGRGLNGQTGVVLRFIEESGRFEIQFSDTNSKQLRPNNLMKLYGEHGATTFKSGDAVEIFGLESAEHHQLNGLTGLIHRFIPDKSRYEVRISNSKTVTVRSQNLMKVYDDPTAFSFSSGDVVTISALTSATGSAMNGQQAVVVKSTDEGRLEVRFASGKLLHVKPCNLTKVGLMQGDLVEICGLQSKQGEELNGWKGTIVQYIEESGRFEVRLPPRRHVCLKPENLRKVDAEQFENYPGRCG